MKRRARKVFRKLMAFLIKFTVIAIALCGVFLTVFGFMYTMFMHNNIFSVVQGTVVMTVGIAVLSFGAYAQSRIYGGGRYA